MKFRAAFRCHNIPQCIAPINTRNTSFINSSRMFVECFNMSNQAWKNFKQNMKDKRIYTDMSGIGIPGILYQQ